MSRSDGVGLISVAFAEEEARFLAGCVQTALDHHSLTAMQRRLASRISAKFLLAGGRRLDELEQQFGAERAERLAGEALAAYPDVECIR